MNTLDLLGLVDKIIPVTEDAGSRRTLYRISDGVFRFWYTFAAPNRSAIELGCGREIFEKEVLPSLDRYSKETFEDICRQYLDLLAQRGDAPFSYDHAGSWWGQHPTRKRTEYVPIAAADDHNILLGDCFWTACRVSRNTPASFPTVQYGTIFLQNLILSQAWKPSMGTQ